jgi:small-conductance mechanosensitive channel
MSGETVVLSISDNDGLWQGTTRQDLARQYSQIIQDKVLELHAEYGLRQKLLGLLTIVFIISLQAFLIWGTNRLYRRLRIRLARYLIRNARPLKIKDYEVLDKHRQGMAFLLGFRLLRVLVIALQLLISIPLLFSAFPETKSLTYRVFGYIWNPITDILVSVLAFVPNLFKIVVIVLCFRYLVKGIRYLLNEIAVGNLKVNGFYADWAEPTFYIVRVLCYSFMLVMIWPLLPSSNSQIFQGVSVFIGIIFSLGSSSIIGNIMAGMVMTYMRPFHIGDFIKYGDTQGFVIEKTVLVTRIRTRKNEVITIPNSSLMSSQTSNFTFAAQNYGVVVHTKVTIGYDMPWTLIRDLLVAAAKATPGIDTSKKPFVHITALDDFYVEYEINAFTHKPDKLSDIYSVLHQNILDSFHTHGVEIMSPHIFAHRNDLELQIPKSQQG